MSTTRPARSTRADRGQAALLLVLLAAAMLAVAVLALAGLGRTSADRTRAQSAADAAALASVDGDRREAVELAAMHGAEVVSWRRGPGPSTVTVTVRLGEVTATARATVGD